MGSYPQPGGEVLLARPLGHIGTDFGQDRLCKTGTNAIDLEIQATDELSVTASGKSMLWW